MKFNINEGGTVKNLRNTLSDCEYLFKVLSLNNKHYRLLPGEHVWFETVSLRLTLTVMTRRRGVP